jgi:hypothetical protein
MRIKNWVLNYLLNKSVVTIVTNNWFKIEKKWQSISVIDKDWIVSWMHRWVTKFIVSDVWNNVAFCAKSSIGWEYYVVNWIPKKWHTSCYKWYFSPSGKKFVYSSQDKVSSRSLIYKLNVVSNELDVEYESQNDITEIVFKWEKEDIYHTETYGGFSSVFFNWKQVDKDYYANISDFKINEKDSSIMHLSVDYRDQDWNWVEWPPKNFIVKDYFRILINNKKDDILADKFTITKDWTINIHDSKWGWYRNIDIVYSKNKQYLIYFNDNLFWVWKWKMISLSWLKEKTYYTFDNFSLDKDVTIVDNRHIIIDNIRYLKWIAF